MSCVCLGSQESSGAEEGGCGNVGAWPRPWDRLEGLIRRFFVYNRAGVSKFYFRCFQNATGSSSAPRKVPELRLELEATLEHARGPEIG